MIFTVCQNYIKRDNQQDENLVAFLRQNQSQICTSHTRDFARLIFIWYQKRYIKKDYNVYKCKNVNRWTFYIKIYPSTNLVTIITHNFLETPQKSDFLIPINNVTLPQRTILDNEYSKYTICSKQDIIDPVCGISAFYLIYKSCLYQYVHSIWLHL